MTVSQQVPIAEYVGNGTTKIFPITFELNDVNDVVVYLNGIEQVGGYVINLTLLTCTFTVAPANDVEVRLRRNVTLTRSSDYQEGGGLSSSSLDYDFDRVVMMMQDLAAVTPKSESTSSFDMGGNRILNVGTPIYATDGANKTYVDSSVSTALASIAPTPVYPVNAPSIVWRRTAHDGVSEFYTTPVYVNNFTNSTLTTNALVFQGYDWFVYAVNAATGADLTGFPFAASGPCYGRCQAADVNGDGLTEIFASTHGGTSGDTGSVYSISSAGTQRWKLYNLYQRVGHNDGILNGVVVGGGTSAGGSVTSATTTTFTDTSTTFPANAFMRYQSNVGNSYGYNAWVYITAGTGAGQIKSIQSCPGGNTITIFGTWSVTPDATSKYQIVPRYASDMYFQHAGTLNNESGTWYLYVTGNDGTCMKVNASTGSIVWTYCATENNEPFPLIATVTGSGLQCLFNSVDTKTHCLNASTGAVIWTNASVAGVGRDSFLSYSDVNADGVQEVIVTVRRSGNATGGRCLIIRGTDGVTLAQSGDMYGDIDSQPLIYPRGDGTGKSWVFIANDAGQLSMLDETGFALWQDTRGDSNGSNPFNSSPIAADINYDGVNEIIACSQMGNIMVYSKTGERLASFMISSRVGCNDSGIEATPICQDINGDGRLELVIPSLDGYVTCYQFAP